MAKGKGNGKGTNPDGRGAEGNAQAEADAALWHAYTQDVDRIAEDKAGEMPPPAAAQQTPPVKTPRVRRTPSLPTGETSHIPTRQQDPPGAAQLDARTDARLRRGRLANEGRLDLHGMTQAEAQERLTGFIVAAQAQGKRCVLVITGKGVSRGGEAGGVLRQKFPLWLSLPPLRGLVLKTYPAAQRDGGSGAWYVYLKRQRDY